MFITIYGSWCIETRPHHKYYEWPSDAKGSTNANGFSTQFPFSKGATKFHTLNYGLFNGARHLITTNFAQIPQVVKE